MDAYPGVGGTEMQDKVSTKGDPTAQHAITERVWDALSKGSFAVISYVTPSGQPRSSGVVYGLAGRHLYIAIGPESWKARHIEDGDQVAVTVPVRRGGPVSLLFPIPPATVSFHARVVLHAAGSLDLRTVSPKLASLVPDERRADPVLELVPEGAFLTYGIGVSLTDLAKPSIAQGHAQVA
jgi:hypothetical protein